MKHLKRILVSFAVGIMMGAIMALVHYLSGNENWLHDALISGWFYCLGAWLGIGMRFYHDDSNF